MESERLIGLSSDNPGILMGDLVQTLLGRGRVTDAQEISQLILTEVAIRELDINEVFKMTVDSFVKMITRPPPLPGWDNFTWGRAVVERNRH